MRHLTLLALIGLAALAASGQARADDYSIDAPAVEAGEISAQANMNYSLDRHRNLDRYFSQVYGIEGGVNSFWSTALSGIFEKTALDSAKLTNLKWQNIVAPFKPGEYWVDAGLALNVEQNVERRDPDNVEVKLLLEKDLGRFMNTANLSLSRDIGAKATSGTDAGYSWRTKYQWSEALEPGFEYYSSLGKLTDIDKYRRQDNVVGPVLQGQVGNIGYDTGLLFGVSNASHDATFKFNLEYTF